MTAEVSEVVALRWAALDEHLRRVDPDRAHPLVSSAAEHVHRVPVDDVFDGRERRGRRRRRERTHPS